MLLLHHTPVKLSISAKDSLMKFYVMQRLMMRPKLVCYNVFAL